MSDTCVNLLDKYIPRYSGHLQGITYDGENRTLEITFFDHPEEFRPAAKLIFKGVSAYIEVQLEEPEKDCIELAISFDYVHGSYCLHTDFRELSFCASNVMAVDVNT
jgi:hypothetical protein